MIKLVAFDWNGTLLADAVVCWKIDNDIFKHLEKPAISFRKYQETFDIPISKMFLAHGFSEKELSEHEDYIVHTFMMPMKPGLLKREPEPEQEKF